MISRIASLPPGRSTRRSSASAALEVGDVPHAEADGRRVEGRVRERQLEQIAVDPLDRRSLRRARSSIGSEKSRPVTFPPAARAAIARSPVPQQASSTSSPGRTTARAVEPAPALVEPESHRPVHRVVDRRDPVEHRAHALGGQGPGLVRHGHLIGPTGRPACSRRRAGRGSGRRRSRRGRRRSRRRGRSRARRRGSRPRPAATSRGRSGG